MEIALNFYVQFIIIIFTYSAGTLWIFKPSISATKLCPRIKLMESVNSRERSLISMTCVKPVDLRREKAKEIYQRLAMTVSYPNS